MMEIELTQGYVAIIDDEDYEKVSKYKWHVEKKAGNKRYAKHVYREDNKAKTLRMHTLIMGEPPRGMVVDHISGDGLDNRRSNLRIISRRENSSNRHIRKRSNSQYQGVFHDKRIDRYRARVRVNGKLRVIGSFEREVDAHKAYDGAVKIIDEIYSSISNPPHGW